MPLNSCLGGGGNDKASNSLEGDWTMVQSSSIDGGVWLLGIAMVVVLMERRLDVEWRGLSSLGGMMYCWNSQLALASSAFVLLEVIIGFEFLGNGGSGIASSPKEDVEERAD